MPGLAHHVTQRGNGRQQTFFYKEDCAFYRDLLREHCAAHGLACVELGAAVRPAKRGRELSYKRSHQRSPETATEKHRRAIFLKA